MKLNKTISFLSLYYVLMVGYWLFLNVHHLTTSIHNYLFVFFYGLLPFIGGIFGIQKSLKWGLFQSAMGRATFFLSLGLITWSLGETIWSFYNLVLHVSIPYPSLADLSFIVSWPLWILGIYFLSFATGAKYGLKRLHGKLLFLIIPVFAIFLSYYLLVFVARQGVFTIEGDALKIFFDIAYPVLDVIILTLALLIYGLSFKYLGGLFKWPVIIILLGFVINYIADFSFSYTTTIETYFNGNYADLLFATAMFILSLGLNKLDQS